jgi:recombination protein RecR
MVRSPSNEVLALAKAVARLKDEVCTCSYCHNLADRDPCSICGDLNRDDAVLCVVETPADLAALEAAGCYKGKYYVLYGALSPLEGMGPEELKPGEFFKRVRNGKVKEVVIATNPTTEGEATADMLARLLEKTEVRVTRLGYGMPVGGDLKYMDGLTLSRSLESRRKID